MRNIVLAIFIALFAANAYGFIHTNSHAFLYDAVYLDGTPIYSNDGHRITRVVVYPNEERTTSSLTDMWSYPESFFMSGWGGETAYGDEVYPDVFLANAGDIITRDNLSTFTYLSKYHNATYGVNYSPPEYFYIGIATGGNPVFDVENDPLKDEWDRDVLGWMLIRNNFDATFTRIRSAMTYDQEFIVVGENTLIDGDFDFDGDVDGRDFLEWQRWIGRFDLPDWQANYGTEPMQQSLIAIDGDFDADGKVDGLDFLHWQRYQDYGFNLNEWQYNYGYVWDGTPSPYPQQIPEPPLAPLVLIIILSILLSRPTNRYKCSRKF